MGYKVTFENNSIIITQITEPLRAEGAVRTIAREGVVKSNHLGASFRAEIGGGGNEQTGPGGGGNEQTGPGGGGNEQTGPGGGGNEQTGPGGSGTQALSFSQGGSFQMETQCESEWCWAAVSTSVDHYFQPGSTLTQCEIASQVMLEDCCTKPRNEAEMLQDALDAVGRLGTIMGRLTFEQLQAEINAKRPVCVRIAWFGGSAHYVALSGYDVLSSGVRTVDVADPFYPDSTEDFDLFPSAYHGGGEWTATFFTKQKQGDSNG